MKAKGQMIKNVPGVSHRDAPGTNLCTGSIKKKCAVATITECVQYAAQGCFLLVSHKLRMGEAIDTKRFGRLEVGWS